MKFIDLNLKFTPESVIIFFFVFFFDRLKIKFVR